MMMHLVSYEENSAVKHSCSWPASQCTGIQPMDHHT